MFATISPEKCVRANWSAHCTLDWWGTSMSESSVVSDLIQRVHSRRLQTDPSDSLLFEPTRGAPRARRDQARWFDSAVVEPAPVRAPQSVAPNPRAPKPVVRPTPERSHVWLLIVATIAAGALGVYGASRLQIGDDAPAASIANPAPAAMQPTLEAAPPAPVAQAPGTAIAPATDTSMQPTVAPVVDTNAQPTVAPPVDTNAPTAAPAVDTNAPAAQPATPTRHRVVKRKKVIVKRIKPRTKQSTVQPAAVAPAPKRVATPSRSAAQSTDSESPL